MLLDINQRGMPSVKLTHITPARAKMDTAEVVR